MLRVVPLGSYVLHTNLRWRLVKEWKSGDEVIESIKSRRHQVLGVVTQQFQDGKHGNTSVLEFGEGSLRGDFWGQVKLSELEVTKETVVVNGSNEEEHLGPAKGRDGVQGSNSVRNICAGKTRGDLTRESEEFWNNISNNSKLGNTSVLKRKESREMRHQ
jgi:hypothetical protein